MCVCVYLYSHVDERTQLVENGFLAFLAVRGQRQKFVGVGDVVHVHFQHRVHGRLPPHLERLGAGPKGDLLRQINNGDEKVWRISRFFEKKIYEKSNTYIVDSKRNLFIRTNRRGRGWGLTSRMIFVFC